MSSHSENSTFQSLIASVDTPAFLRRAQGVEAEWNSLLSRCRRQRDEWLHMPRIRLEQLLTLIEQPGGSSEDLNPVEVRELQRIARDVEVVRKPNHSAMRSGGGLASVYSDLRLSVERFNDRWQKFISDIDLTKVNALREGYNAFYVLEKECAGASPKVARLGFVPMSPVTVQDLWDLFPLIRLPKNSSDHS